MPPNAILTKVIILRELSIGVKVEKGLAVLE